MDKELAGALDDLILGRGVGRGRHSLQHQGRSVLSEFEERLQLNGFTRVLVESVRIEAGQRVPAFYLHDGTADFGWVRWEIFTPRSRRKLFASEYRRPDNQEWAVQLPPGSPDSIWADLAHPERHDVETVVAVHP